jgi:thymidylate synthase
LANVCITNKRESVLDFVYKDFVVVGYTPHDSIKAEVAV